MARKIGMSDWHPPGAVGRQVHWWDDQAPLGVLTVIGVIVFALLTGVISGLVAQDMGEQNERDIAIYEQVVKEYEQAKLNHTHKLDELAQRWQAMRADEFDNRHTAQYVLWAKARGLALAEVSDEDNLELLTDLQRSLGWPYADVDAPTFVSIVNGTQEWPQPVFERAEPEYPALESIDWYTTAMWLGAMWQVVFFLSVVFALHDGDTFIFNAANIRLSTAWIGVLMHPLVVIPWGYTVVRNACAYAAEHTRREKRLIEEAEVRREAELARMRAERERLSALDPDLRALYEQSKVVREEMHNELAGLRALKHVDPQQIDQLEERLRVVDDELARVFNRQESREQAADQQRVLAVMQRLEESFAVLRGMANQVEEYTNEQREAVGLDARREDA